MVASRSQCSLKGNRSEPITLYALAESGDSRWLTTYNAHPEPQVVERTVDLKKGEGIRPDAGRPVRTTLRMGRQSQRHQRRRTRIALNWLEVEGPLYNQWPPASYQALFGELPRGLRRRRCKNTSRRSREDCP